jgi:hypothetical protein
VIVRWEEGVLAGLYGEEYSAYCRAVPRFAPRVPRAAAQVAAETGDEAADRDPYPWSKVLRRERGAIATAFVIVLLALLRQGLAD